MENYNLTIDDGNIIIELNSNFSITSSTMITTEEFTYTGVPFSTAQIPNGNMILVYDGQSRLEENNDYTRSSNQYTVNSGHPFVEIGDTIKIIYTY